MQKQVARLQSQAKDTSLHLPASEGILQRICSDLEEAIASCHRTFNARKLSKGVKLIQNLRMTTIKYMKDNDIDVATCETNIF